MKWNSPSILKTTNLSTLKTLLWVLPEVSDVDARKKQDLKSEEQFRVKGRVILWEIKARPVPASVSFWIVSRMFQTYIHIHQALSWGYPLIRIFWPCR